jgi:dipeptidase D
MESNIYCGLTPPELWRHFASLNRIPRPSGREDAARNYARQIAESRRLRTVVDSAGNLLIYVPATKQAQDDHSEEVAIQCHLDMVCEKEDGVVHDFAVDPIQPRRKGDRIGAAGTTLGADNGIGVSAALALLTTQDLQHGPLELIFTVEEETGLYGAAALDTSLLRSRRLLNLDSENPDGLTVGSAGGATMIISLEAPHEKFPSNWVWRELSLSGLRGGHSGLQIHERLGNAIKLLADTLGAVRAADIRFQIAALQGGTLDNAIPRQCNAVLAMSPLSATRFDAFIRERRDALMANWSADEPSILVNASPSSAHDYVWSGDFSQSVLDLLLDLPHGALKMSSTFEGSVETSANLATIRTEMRRVEIVVGTRSFAPIQLDWLLACIRSRAERLRSTVEIRDEYPVWQPNLDSPLLNLAEEVFRHVQGRSPLIQVLHGGLECGLIVSKVPQMDAISFGPLIRFAHTPQEYVTISSVGAMWKILLILLKALSEIGPGGLRPSTRKLRVSAMT